MSGCTNSLVCEERVLKVLPSSAKASFRNFGHEYFKRLTMYEASGQSGLPGAFRAALKAL
jgi:hypothetical protein